MTGFDEPKLVLFQIDYYSLMPITTPEPTGGDNAGCLLRGVAKTDIERGQVLCKPGSIHPHTKFKGQVYVLSKDEGDEEGQRIVAGRIGDIAVNRVHQLLDAGRTVGSGVVIGINE